MSDSNDKPNWEERLAEAYDRMLARVRAGMEEMEKESRPMLHNAIENAKETATELGELSREEAEKVGQYLRRDVEHAAAFISRSGQDLGGWLRFDTELAERTLIDMMFQVADQTEVELAEFNARAEALGEWHTGEISGIGTLECKSCGEQLHFHRTGHIPPCPKCHGTTFRRISDED